MNETLKEYKRGDHYIKVVKHTPETKFRTPRTLIFSKIDLGGLKQLRSIHEYSPELLRHLYKDMINA